MDNPYCSCNLTRVRSGLQLRHGRRKLEIDAARSAARERERAELQEFQDSYDQGRPAVSTGLNVDSWLAAVGFFNRALELRPEHPVGEGRHRLSWGLRGHSAKG